MPPSRRSTLVRAWRDDGRPDKPSVVMADREWAGRAASPSAAIIDSQSVKITEAGGPRGYDAGKKINGRKRHAIVDTEGRGLVLEPHPANIQDRDGRAPLLRASCRSFPFIRRFFADGRYACEKVAKATLIAVEIVRKNRDHLGFAVNPRRWVRRGILRMDRAQSTAGKGLRGHHRLRAHLPLRGICHAARTSDCSLIMTFETDTSRRFT